MDNRDALVCVLGKGKGDLRVGGAERCQAGCPGSDLEAIRKLGELKEKGVVTEDEFQRKKQELLSRV